ncbi:MAG TPA: hypothetical protein GXX30_01640 [Firmicutes bacterium]|nr:hypothetical protein [Candidatus Fermentithermobacillaceae bacterium]
MLLRSEFLTKRSPANQVHIFTDELLALYHRPYLIDYPGGEVRLEPLVVCPEDWYRGEGNYHHLTTVVSHLHFALLNRVLEGTPLLELDRVAKLVRGQVLVSPC